MIRVAIFLLAAASVAAQDFSHVVVEHIARGLDFAEGPVWSRDGYLLFSDTVTNTLHKFTPDQGVSVAETRVSGANGNTIDVDGRIYTCEFRERRVTRTSKHGKIEVLAARYQGKRLNAPNDIVVRHDGHVWFTDPAFGDQQDARELDFYGVFHLTPKGELDAAAKWKTRPKGIALSPNGHILYVSDSDQHLIRAYDIERSGALSNERVAIDKIPGVAAGIRTDEKGNLYVAAKALYVYSPEGALLGSVILGETPSNLAFGDGDLASLFITARTSVFRVRLGVKGALQY